MGDKEFVVSIYDKETCTVPFKLNLPKDKVTIAQLVQAMSAVERIYIGIPGPDEN